LCSCARALARAVAAAVVCVARIWFAALRAVVVIASRAIATRHLVILALRALAQAVAAAVVCLAPVHLSARVCSRQDLQNTVYPRILERQGVAVFESDSSGLQCSIAAAGLTLLLTVQVHSRAPFLPAISVFDRHCSISFHFRRQCAYRATTGIRIPTACA